MPVFGFCNSKCKYEVYTKEETYSKEEVNNLMENVSVSNYSYGTSEPTGGADGDIYDQYFD